VAVAPYLLLATGGLAYARRLGVFGLVLVVIMWAQDSAPVEKSNVRAIAHTIGPSLAPGDLVISTQPETIPLLHYYLPDGLRYATLTGEERDFGVWDWRDGVERLEATSAEADLAPLIASLAPGTRVVLVEPIVWTLNRWRAPWTKLIRTYLAGRASLARIFVMIDSRHGIKNTDVEILDELDKAAVSYQIVLTKSDQLKPSEREERRDLTLQQLSRRPAAYPEVIMTSSREGDGIPDLRAAIQRLLNELGA